MKTHNYPRSSSHLRFSSSFPSCHEGTIISSRTSDNCRGNSVCNSSFGTFVDEFLPLAFRILTFPFFQMDRLPEFLFFLIFTCMSFYYLLPEFRFFSHFRFGMATRLQLIASRNITQVPFRMHGIFRFDGFPRTRSEERCLTCDC